jgi:hypothetical protein
MTTFLKLHGHTVEQFPGGLSVIAIARTFTFADGTAVEFPLPFLPIGNDLVITPAVKVNGDKTLTVDLSRWAPGLAAQRGVAVFPLNFGTQADAVKVARAYHADPATSWTDPLPTVLAWLRTWGSANGLNLTGLDDIEVPA